jgi:hypothetical protein
MNLYGFANGDPINGSDPFGLCDPMPQCLEGLGSLREGLDEVKGAIESIPSQVRDFANDPLKGGFVAQLASIPLAAAAAGSMLEAAPAAAGVTETAISSATNALERAAIRIQVTALNNPVGAYLTGFGLGYSGLPVPQGFGAVKLGAQHGQFANAAAKAIKVIVGSP